MEKSIVKGIPISELDRVRPKFKLLADIAGKRLRIRFRGPRRDSMALYCLKKDAKSFAIYFE